MADTNFIHKLHESTYASFIVLWTYSQCDIIVMLSYKWKKKWKIRLGFGWTRENTDLALISHIKECIEIFTYVFENYQSVDTHSIQKYSRLDGANYRLTKINLSTFTRNERNQLTSGILIVSIECGFVPLDKLAEAKITTRYSKFHQQQLDAEKNPKMLQFTSTGAVTFRIHFEW